MALAMENIYNQIGYKHQSDHEDEVVEEENVFGTDNSDMQVSSDTIRRRIDRKVHLCEECGEKMYKSSIDSLTQHYICDKCGRIEDFTGADVDNHESEGMNDYNTSDNSAVPVRITGPNSYAFQKKLISNTSNYKKQQFKNTSDQIHYTLYQYKGPTLPNNIITTASEFYYQVQQHCILRGDVRKGTMAACLSKICEKNNIIRKPKEIADIFGIPQSELSNGEKILDQLFAEGILRNLTFGTIKFNEAREINQFYYYDSIESFLTRYFECLNISDEYLTFASRLVQFTIKYHIADSSINSSKCAGAIFILSLKIPELKINKTDIERECNISKSTFGRFYSAIDNVLESKSAELRHVRRRLRRIFKKNNVSL